MSDVSYFKLDGDDTIYSFDDADGEVRIAQNAADIDALSTDSGWIDLAPVFYRKVGNTVFVSCHAQYSGTLTGRDWTTIATLPAGFRPSRRYDAAVALGSNAEVVGSVRIGASGNIDIYPSAAITTTPYIAFSASYPV
jgi:hypothetical protein